jgi:hypothetical protein
MGGFAGDSVTAMLEVVWSFAGLCLVVGAFTLPLWALKRHARMFPPGWDRTGWTTERG